ncbi:MAG: hypothetical protein K0R67_2299 [Paenibacillus sp.]|nr:hypothetical protein [Paenibacillus sp.]
MKDKHRIAGLLSDCFHLGRINQTYRTHQITGCQRPVIKRASHRALLGAAPLRRDSLQLCTLSNST